ncbi:hypothetical protein BS47DRAFT_1364614 [Hydnum rufescens UP504]|uniref:Uncharacterized protein n=1 Tax=Hydnum rufescens UP504 TaxID=1448309 RepID=A0A9P6ARE3_9AGAM|nr:hypothetical protein BS47DRAFT_1364614 [Hydnum rufescens UP504]
MVPHTCLRWVCALLECTDRDPGRNMVAGAATQDPNGHISATYDETNTSATHPPKWVHSLRDIRPNRCTGRVQDETQGPRSHPYPPTLNFPRCIRGQNKYGATHPLKRVCGNIRLSPSAKPDPNNAQTTPTAKYGSAQPPKTRTPSTIRKIHDDASNMVPHTRFGGYLHCAIPNLTNAQIRPRAKHSSVQPPRPPTLDYPHLTKQIRHHTSAEAAPLSLRETPSDEWPEKAYSEIWSVQPIRPQPPSLENYNTTTNQICHTPASAGVWYIPSAKTTQQADEDTDEPPVQHSMRSHQATSARPQTMIDEITYHTPAEAGVWYIYCVISDPTNAQIRPRAKHGTMQPPIPPDPRFPSTYKRNPHTMRPQKSWMNPTPALAGVIIFKTRDATEQIHENSNPRPKQNPGTKPANEMTRPKVNRQATPLVPHPP